MTQVIAYVSDDEIIVPASSLPVAVPVAVPTIGGVNFYWNLSTDIRPYSWQMRYKIDGGAWSHDWTTAEGKTVENSVFVPTGAGVDLAVVINIEVRSIDGAGNVTTAGTASATSLGLADFSGTTLLSNSVLTATIKDLNVTTAKIALDAINETLIANDAIQSEHYKDASILTAHIGNLQVDTAQIAADAIDGTKIANLAIDSEHIVTGAIDTAHIGNLQITNALIAAGTIEYAKFETVAKTYMFASTTSLGKLIDALDIATMDTLDTNDHILIVGTNENISGLSAGNKTSIKTSLSLNLVENKAGATIVADNLNDTILGTATTAILDAEVITKINALASGSIGVARLAMITPAVIGAAAKGDILDSSGYNKIGIYGSAARTSAAIQASMDVSGNSLLWDPTSWKAGTDTSNIPAGNIAAAAQFVTANEKTGADRGYNGLHTDFSNKIGIYNGSLTASAVNVYAATMDTIQLWNVSGFTAGGAATITASVITTTSGAWVVSQYRIAVRYNASWNTLRFKVNALASNAGGTNEFRIQVRDTQLTPVVLDTGAGVEVGAITSATYDQFETYIDISAGFAGISDGELINIDIDFKTDNPDTVTIREAILTAER